MGQELTTQKTASELLAQAAEELSGDNIGRILKFAKGKYYLGDDEVAINSEMVAHIEQLARGWVKFKDGELVDRRIGKVIDGFSPPPREELDDTDSSKWEKNDRGEPKDPWVAQSYLPLETPETGEVVVFVTGSAGGMGAIGALVRTASRHLQKGPPLIQLGVRSYKHKQYGRIENPDFQIIGWSDMPAAAKNPPKGEILPSVVAASARSAARSPGTRCLRLVPGTRLKIGHCPSSCRRRRRTVLFVTALPPTT
jgi:hypothetical protein